MHKIQTRLNIIYISFLFSSLVYLIVGYALTKSGWKPVLAGSPLDLILFGIFLGLAILLTVIAVHLKNRILPGSSDVPETALQKSIFLFALSEVPAIFGLVVFLLTGKFLYLVILCAVSILSFVLVKPR